MSFSISLNLLAALILKVLLGRGKPPVDADKDAPILDISAPEERRFINSSAAAAAKDADLDSGGMLSYCKNDQWSWLSQGIVSTIGKG